MGTNEVFQRLKKKYWTNVLQRAMKSTWLGWTETPTPLEASSPNISAWFCYCCCHSWINAYLRSLRNQVESLFYKSEGYYNSQGGTWSEMGCLTNTHSCDGPLAQVCQIWSGKGWCRCRLHSNQEETTFESNESWDQLNKWVESGVTPAWPEWKPAPMPALKIWHFFFFLRLYNVFALHFNHELKM